MVHVVLVRAGRGSGLKSDRGSGLFSRISCKIVGWKQEARAFQQGDCHGDMFPMSRQTTLERLVTQGGGFNGDVVGRSVARCGMV